MSIFYFTADMKLADLIHTDYRLLLLLPRFGLNLGIGEKTVKECCEKRHISVSLFLMIANLYTFEQYIPDAEVIDQLDIDPLILYLQNSHSYYLNHRIKSIEERLPIVADQSVGSHKKILSQFFQEYKNEVINHFNYEENIVFPYILNMRKGIRSTGYHIEIFEQNHSNIDDKLNDLKNIIIKYLPEHAELSERTHILFDIFSLEKDLRKHTLIEDKILIPLVQKLEACYAK